MTGTLDMAVVPERKFLPVAFLPARVMVSPAGLFEAVEALDGTAFKVRKKVGLEWPDAAEFVGMRLRPSRTPEEHRLALKALEKRFYRWTRSRGIEPDAAGLYSVVQLAKSFSAED